MPNHNLINITILSRLFLDIETTSDNMALLPVLLKSVVSRL